MGDSSGTVHGARNAERVQMSGFLEEIETLVKGAKNFNLHITVLKKLLNLKERQTGQGEESPFAERTTAPFCSRKASSSSARQEPPDTNDSLRAIKEKMVQLKKEIEESHLLGFCLAFNVQRLQQRLTGLPIDANATDNVLESLWEKYQKTKNGEAMLKYEFDEKRKLLRKLRQQLEQTRRDWKNFKIKKPEPTSEEEQRLWAQLRADFARKAKKQESDETGDTSNGRAPSEVDSAVHSDDGGEGDPGDERQSSASSGSSPGFLVAFDERSHRLDQLEEECYQLVNRLARRHQQPAADATEPSDSDEEDDDDEECTQLHAQLLATELLAAEEDLVPSDGGSEDFDEAPLVEEALAFDINSGLLDDTEDAEMSDLPWDSASAEPSGAATAASTLLQVELLPVAEGLGPMTRSRTSSLISHGTVNEEEEQRLRESLAETGEPIVLCRLRRKAVEILISRLREEKKFHETRENELRVQLSKLRQTNSELQLNIDCLDSRTWFGRKVGLALLGLALLANLATAFNLLL